MRFTRSQPDQELNDLLNVVGVRDLRSSAPYRESLPREREQTRTYLIIPRARDTGRRPRWFCSTEPAYAVNSTHGCIANGADLARRVFQL